MQFICLVVVLVCIFIFGQTRTNIQLVHKRPVYVVTAITPSQIQLPQVIRLGNTLNLIENVHWILVSGSVIRREVQEYLDRLNIPFTTIVGGLKHLLHYLCITKVFHANFTDQHGNLDAFLYTVLKLIHKRNSKGLLMFCKTDRVVDTAFFEKIHKTKRISLWPIGNSPAMKYQAIFNTDYLFQNGIPEFGDKMLSVILPYLSTLKHLPNDIEIYNDTKEVCSTSHLCSVGTPLSNCDLL